MSRILERSIITSLSPKSPEAEAFRILRTNLQFTSIDKKMKKILFTSSGQDEGKSSTIANLAVTMAQASKKVVIIDCDLRQPVQHKMFQLDNINGITNSITGQVDINESIKETDVENLFVIPSGPIPPNPSEILSSQKMEEIITVLDGKFDYLLFDSPPAIAVTDPVVLSPKMDGVVLVIKSGYAKLDKLQEIKCNIEKVGGNVIGAILNKVKVPKREYYNYYYYERGEE